ncbi:hypothetical protein COV11_02300 [Candidatus Woesearchaeota archaeon CG10_big_fil_rev_8_21_14_0_10_30_7]|nr:MAG: hypothetical protein COV11_02300 [Candidatus Woesearchaeota archaeon CG10_big_fil_rev_8_21_14_0_10_30_7]
MGEYELLKERVYKNKLARKFNTIKVNDEIVLMTEELGELSDALMQNDAEGIIDALGDITVYCLGLCGMFEWNADEVYQNAQIKQVKNHFYAISSELGKIANTYKKSNKQPVWNIDKTHNFKEHIGNLMKYCESAYLILKQEKSFVQVLEKIIKNNEVRTHQGKI